MAYATQHPPISHVQTHVWGGSSPLFNHRFTLSGQTPVPPLPCNRTTRCAKPGRIPMVRGGRRPALRLAGLTPLRHQPRRTPPPWNRRRVIISANCEPDVQAILTDSDSAPLGHGEITVSPSPFGLQHPRQPRGLVDGHPTADERLERPRPAAQVTREQPVERQRDLAVNQNGRRDKPRRMRRRAAGPPTWEDSARASGTSSFRQRHRALGAPASMVRVDSASPRSGHIGRPPPAGRTPPRSRLHGRAPFSSGHGVPFHVAATKQERGPAAPIAASALDGP